MLFCFTRRRGALGCWRVSGWRGLGRGSSETAGSEAKAALAREHGCAEVIFVSGGGCGEAGSGVDGRAGGFGGV